MTVDEFLRSLSANLPSLLAALAILLIGWIVARLAHTLVQRFVPRTRLDARLAGLVGEDDEAMRTLVADRIARITYLAIWLSAIGLFISSIILIEPIATIVRIGTLELGALFQIRVVSAVVQVAVAIVLTALLVYLLRGMDRINARLYRRLDKLRQMHIRPITFQNLVLIPADRIAGFVFSLARVARILVFLIILYFYISLVLSLFPETGALGTSLFGFVATTLLAITEAIISYLPSLFTIVVIIVAARYITRFVGFLFRALGSGTIAIPGFFPEWAEPTSKLVSVLVIVFAAVLIFPHLPGASSPAFQGISIFIGFLVSLGSTSIVSNIVSGIVLTYTRAFQVGDRVKIADTTGDVREKSLLVTRVRTIKNVDITIPNALVLGSHIVNFSSSAQKVGLILHTSVTIGYDAPWKRVHQLLIAAALATDGVQKEPQPFVLQTSLDDFYVRYELNAYTDQPNHMAVIYSTLHENIQDRFNEAGVEIMSPHYSNLRDGNPTTIPTDYLPKEYKPPTFNIASRRDAGEQ